MDQSPSWEANQSLQLVKKFTAFLWNPKILHRTHKFPVEIILVIAEGEMVNSLATGTIRVLYNNHLFTKAGF
jgi:hypothetical protein